MRRFLLALVLLLGLAIFDEHNADGFRKYKNERYGYSFEVPRNWGVIQLRGPMISLEEYDKLDEKEGPYGNYEMGWPDEENYRNEYNVQKFIGVEIFDDNMAGRNPGESWLDFYKKLRLEEQNYVMKETDGGFLVDLFYNGELCGWKRGGVEKQECQGDFVNEDDCANYVTLETFCVAVPEDIDMYLATCKLMENNNKLFTFCYDSLNPLHQRIVDSVEVF